jgi:hypothetical protein
VALAILLTFVLTPPVTWLERWIGRTAAVLTVVTLLFAVVALAGRGLARHRNHLAEDLHALLLPALNYAERIGSRGGCRRTKKPRFSMPLGNRSRTPPS